MRLFLQTEVTVDIKVLRSQLGEEIATLHKERTALQLNIRELTAQCKVLSGELKMLQDSILTSKGQRAEKGAAKRCAHNIVEIKRLYKTTPHIALYLNTLMAQGDYVQCPVSELSPGDNVILSNKNKVQSGIYGVTWLGLTVNGLLCEWIDGTMHKTHGPNRAIDQVKAVWKIITV